MDNTTLHTFIFYCPAALRSVTLLGSWDNFSRPYPLELDSRRGRTYWKGCFTFRDIICDGDLDHLSAKRDGLLKMGGTYWYYYKVDEDEECHNPSEPSTTLCPLLPGQRLNVLDLPIEGHGLGNPETSDVFTRNPKDRYLTPVPPAPLKPAPSPRLSGSSATSAQSHVMPLPSPRAPRSATYPSGNALVSPHGIRHARSASASPRFSSTPVFVDLKGFKEKLAMKQSKIRCPSKPKELEIGLPVLVSTTNEDLNLVPLSAVQPQPTPSPRSPSQSRRYESRSGRALPRGFSPLASHPVDPEVDSLFESPATAQPTERQRRRRRSHVPSTVITSEFKLEQCRMRANSADTRNTQHYLFSNDPWLQSPKHQEFAEKDGEPVANNTPPPPVPSRPSSSFSQSTVREKPRSRNGSYGGRSTVQSPLDKELPELPRYLTPAPLFSYRSSTATTMIAEEPVEGLQKEETEFHDEFEFDFAEKPRSHFSMWSTDSYSLDDDMAQSPTFSTVTSESSDYDSPQSYPARESMIPDVESAAQTPTIFEDEVFNIDEEQAHITYLSPTPPQLEDLRLSTFGSESFDLDFYHEESSPRRQASCFGLGVYNLPESEATAKTSMPEKGLQDSKFNAQRGSAMSQLTKLVDDFAFLGESVL